MLKEHTQYRIEKITASHDSDYRKKLFTMGLLPGTIIRVMNYAPFGKTIRIEVEGTHLAVRAPELNCLVLEEISS